MITHATQQMASAPPPDFDGPAPLPAYDEPPPAYGAPAHDGNALTTPGERARALDSSDDDDEAERDHVTTRGFGQRRVTFMPANHSAFLAGLAPTAVNPYGTSLADVAPPTFAVRRRLAPW